MNGPARVQNSTQELREGEYALFDQSANREPTVRQGIGDQPAACRKLRVELLPKRLRTDVAALEQWGLRALEVLDYTLAYASGGRAIQLIPTVETDHKNTIVEQLNAGRCSLRGSAK